MSSERRKQLERYLAVSILSLLIISLCAGFAWMLMLVAASLAASGSVEWGKTWETWEKVTGVLEHVITAAALIGGGVVTYYRFFKGRVWKARLELDISGETSKIGDRSYLWVTAELRNVGSSKVDLSKDGVSLQVFAERLKPQAGATEAQRYRVRSVAWESLWPFDIFERHEWIEPGETIRDQTLIELLADAGIPYKLDLVIYGSGTRWSATTIVGPGLKKAADKRRDGDAREESGNG
jgi:hypothetical protein